MAIDRTVNNVMVSRVVNMLNIEIIPIIDDYKISSIGPIKLKILFELFIDHTIPFFSNPAFKL